jgi:hypothetical protein
MVDQHGFILWYFSLPRGIPVIFYPSGLDYLWSLVFGIQQNLSKKMKSLWFSVSVLILMFVMVTWFYQDGIGQDKLNLGLFACTLLWFIGKFFLERKKT